jgi:DNA repair protein RadC
MFSGTLTQTSVYPREFVKRIFAHNHPSGIAQPSNADELIANQLKEALALEDVRLLDHFILVGNTTLSFVERGLL